MQRKRLQKPPVTRIPFTMEGYDALLVEQKELLASRPDAVAELKRAREMGDLSENGFYKGARAKVSNMDHRLRQLIHLIRYAIIKDVQKKDVVDIGTTVTIFDGKEEVTYTIVGSFEASPSEGKISQVSPLGNALIGKRVQEQAVIDRADGKAIYTIIRIH